MELLIPGLILVALMVYASTRIKKTAAAAFDAEFIDTTAFSIEKPEGFLSVVGGPLEFEAYSRDFGVEGAEDVRKVRVEIRKLAGRELEEVADEIASSEEVVATTNEVIDGRKYSLLETKRLDKGNEFRDHYKLSGSDGDVFELKVITLAGLSEEVQTQVDRLIVSFVLK